MTEKEPLGASFEAVPVSQENRIETARRFFENQVKKMVGEDRAVTFKNLEAFIVEGKKFLFGFTQAKDPKEPRGFFKLSRVLTGDEPPHMRLERELAGMNVASALDVPTVRHLNEYRQTSEGYALLHLEALDSAQGDLLSSPELVASAPVEYGAWSAETLLKISGRPIPPELSSPLLKREDLRNQSPETFWQVWEDGVTRVFPHLEGKQKEHLMKLAEEAKETLQRFIQAGKGSEQEYFVHNDASPSNMFYDRSKQRALLLDYEYVGATNNRSLAMLTDLGNFYGRGWPNPEFQVAFLERCLEQTPVQERSNMKIVLRAIAVYGSIYMAKYAAAKGTREHPMAESLLNNLEGNLAQFDKYAEELDK